MGETVGVLEKAVTRIGYGTVKELSVFQEHYDRLTREIQQAKVQLSSSPPLEGDSTRARQRAEWRDWLELQVRTRDQTRTALVQALAAKGIVVEGLPD